MGIVLYLPSWGLTYCQYFPDGRLFVIFAAAMKNLKDDNKSDYSDTNCAIIWKGNN